MYYLEYKIEIDEVEKILEKNYFAFRDLFYRMLIVVLRDIYDENSFNNIVIEDASYNGLLNSFLTRREEVRKFISFEVVNLDVANMLTSVYEQIKITLEKAYRKDKLVVLNLNIKNSIQLELIVKYLELLR